MGERSKPLKGISVLCRCPLGAVLPGERRQFTSNSCPTMPYIYIAFTAISMLLLNLYGEGSVRVGRGKG